MNCSLSVSVFFLLPLWALDGAHAAVLYCQVVPANITDDDDSLRLCMASCGRCWLFNFSIAMWIQGGF